MIKSVYIYLNQLILVVILAVCGGPDGEAQTVYITKTGNKYHRGHCGYLKYSKFPITLKEAHTREYDPCKICRPDLEERSDDESPETYVITPEKSDVDVRCGVIAKTTARQCKRITNNANGRCWQHQ